jgi:hypothetical protein
MKINLAPSSWTRLRNLVLAAALTALGSAATVCEAASSPVGTWDFVSSGSGQQGLAYITFDSDNTFNGFVLVAGKRESGPTGRDGAPASGRNDSDSSSGSSHSSFDILFGSTPINGPWHFDNKGRVVGFFTELVNIQSVVTNYGPTNVLEFIPAQGNGNPSTNVLVFFADDAPSTTVIVTWTAPVPESLPFTFNNPNFVIEVGSAALTNAISFTGKVNGKNFDMVSSTSLGKVTYQGLKAKALVDRTGQLWNGSKKAGSQVAIEFFELGAPVDPLFPNVYPIVNGVGPGYTFDGFAVFSRHGKVGFTSVAGSTLRATLGSKKNEDGLTVAKTKGVEEPGSNIKYTATVQP